MRQRDRDPSSHQHTLPRERHENVLHHRQQHEQVDDERRDQHPQYVRQLQPQSLLTKGSEVRGTQVIVGRIDARLRRDDHDDAEHAHHVDDPTHDAGFRSLGAGNHEGEHDADDAREREGGQVKRNAEGEALVKLDVLALAQGGVIHRVHHENPHAHVTREYGEPPGPTRGEGQRQRRRMRDPFRVEAVLHTGPDHRSDETEEVDGQQHAVDLVEKAAHPADDERGGCRDHDEAPEPHLATERRHEGVGHERSFEDCIVDRDKREDDHGDHGAGLAENGTREGGDGGAVVDRVLREHGVDDAVDDD